MAIFVDDFERANGALGANWGTPGTAGTITSGTVSGGSTWHSNCTAVSENNRHEVSAHMLRGSSGTQYNGVLVKASDSSTQSYYLGFTDAGSTPTIKLRRGITYGGAELDSYTFSSYLPPYVKLTLIWDNGTLYGYVDDVLVVQADDATFATQTRMGIGGYGSSSVFTDFRCVGGEAIQFDAAPSLVPNYGDATTITLTGTGTAWTSGTPGSPTFTADHGTLSGQVVASATSATVSFDPGDYLGPVVFTDPSTGLTDTVMVTSDTGVLPPGGTFLSQEAIDYIERSAIAETNPTILNRDTSVGSGGETASAEIALGELRLSAYKATWTVEGDPSTAALLYSLWRLVNGQNDPPVGPYPAANFDSLDAGLGLIKADLDALMGESEWTIPDLLAYLGGTPFASHADIITAIEGIEGGSNQDVLDALATIRGDESATLAGIVSLITQLATIAGYDLGDVLDAIALIPTNPLTSLQPVMDKLDLIQPSTSYSLTSVAGQVTSLAGDVADVALELAAVKAIVEAIAAALGAAQSGPVWPGLDNVTLGEPVALSNGLVLEGPMHGVIVTIANHPAGAGKYVFGNVTSWTHAGALIFYSDRNDYERAESFGLDSQLINPRTMQEAAGCIVRLTQGWTGTIRTWSRSA